VEIRSGGDDVLLGGAGDDTLIGGAGNDTLDGGIGNDSLQGGAGNDVYRFGPGYGTDTITDIDYTAGNLDAVEIDAPAAEASVRRTGSNFELRLATGDLLVVSGWFSGTAQKIEQMSFSDNTVWDAGELEALGNAGFDYVGTSAGDFLTGSDGPDTLEGLEGNDQLQGLAGDDLLVGGPGSDTLQGGPGDDVYRYAPGDGTDTIFEGGGFDALEFGAGIAPADVIISRISTDLVLYVPGGRVWFSLWFFADASRVEAIRFADGTEWSSGFLLAATQLSELGDFVRGSGADDRLDALGGDDTVWGGPGNDELLGGAGDDWLGGEGGDDVLDGGAGRDILSGGPGNDRYRFDAGYGDDWVTDSGGVDEVEFGAGLAPADLVFTRDQSNLYVAAGADRLTLVDWFYRPETRVETFSFADGTAFDEAAVRRSILVAAGTSLADTIFGSDAGESISGSYGEDALYGEGGDDVLDGGQGSDYLLGGPGDDVYFVDNRLDRVTENPGEGNDTVVTTASYALPDNVENLTLSGSAAINGTGNDGDNVIVGNAAVNLITGGAGNDSLQGGAGNDTYRFGPADGSDEITDFDPTPGNVDQVLFTADVQPGDVRVSRVDDDIRLRTAGGGEVLLRNWYDPDHRVESVAFADGTVWDSATIDALASLPSNQPPVVSVPIADQTATEDSAYVFAVPADAFYDADTGDVLSFTARLADGTELPAWIAFDPASSTFAGTPTNEDVGVIEIAVTATDGSGESATDVFALEVLNTNDAPVTADDAAAVSEDGLLAASGNVLANDIDVDAGTVLAVANPGTYALGYGTLDLAASGAYTYTLDNAAAQVLRGGQLVRDAFEYVATDGIELVPGALEVAIVGANDAPLAADDAASVAEDGQLIAAGNVLENDSDVDAATVLTVVTAGTYLGDYGTLTLAADGAYAYELDNDRAQSLAAGRTAHDEFGYRIADDAAAPLTADARLIVSVAGTNDAPALAAPLPDQLGRETVALDFVLPADSFVDIDAGDSLTYSASLQDDSALPDWLVFDPQSARFSGTPGIADGGEYSIRVTATDAAGASADGLFDLTVVDSLLQDDCVIGTPDNDILNGTNADDCFEGNGGDDLILAGAGNDSLDGGPGADTLVGGAGDDLYFVDSARVDDDGHEHGHRHRPIDPVVDSVVERPDEGYDTVVAYGSYALPDNVEALRLAGGEDLEGRGNSGDNVLVGNPGDNLLSGGFGSDLYVYEPGGGKDTIVEAGAIGEIDVLRFADGVSSDRARLKRRHNDLVVDLGGHQGEVTVADWFAAAENRVELIEFADGRGWDEAQILERLGRHKHEWGGWVDPGQWSPHDEEWRPASTIEPPQSGSSAREPAYDPAQLIADRLAAVPQYDFSALVAAYDAAQRETQPGMSPEEIERRWLAVAEHAQALGFAEDENMRYAAPWLAGGRGWLFAQAAGAIGGFGFEGSIGAARGPEGLRTFEGLREGLVRLE